MRFLQFFGGGIYAPDPSTYDPIEILLNTDDTGEQDELTVKWRENKLSELSFVGVVVCYNSSTHCITSFLASRVQHVKACTCYVCARILLLHIYTSKDILD